MYIKILDESTKWCNVMTPNTPAEIEACIKAGFIEAEAELAYNGLWYVKGYAPAKPKEQRLAELDAQYAKDRAELKGYYADFIIEGDTESADEIRQELADLKAEYEEEYEKIKEENA